MNGRIRIMNRNWNTRNEKQNYQHESTLTKTFAVLTLKNALISGAVICDAKLAMKNLKLSLRGPSKVSSVL